MTTPNNPIRSGDTKYFFLPAQLIEHDDAIILRRGVTQVRITGDDVLQLLNTLMVLASEDGATIDEMVTYFGEANEPVITYLVDQLIGKRILVDQAYHEQLAADSGPEELKNFRWAMGMDSAAQQKVADSRLRILGVNRIAHQLYGLLQQSGFADVTVIDYLPFRNLYYFDDHGRVDTGRWSLPAHHTISYQQWLDDIETEPFHGLIATTDFGGLYAMRPFNKFCVENKLFFLPVGVQNLKAFIGPLVVPGYTACFECLLQRQNSNMYDFEVKRIVELSDYEGQFVHAAHPAMLSSAADIAAMELFKFYSGMTDLQNTGRSIEVNLLNLDLRNKQVLKVPRCPVCSGIHTISNTSVSENAFMPTHYE